MAQQSLNLSGTSGVVGGCIMKLNCVYSAEDAVDVMREGTVMNEYTCNL